MTYRSFSHRRHERGITSFFAVMFAATLMTIIMISFAVLMLREQGRSSDDELSQNAYDSAMAGVEDAKRVVARSMIDPSVANTLYANSESCDVIYRAIGVGGGLGRETMVKSSNAAGQEMEQAYTCVTIKLDSDEYLLDNVNPQESRVVPLRGTTNFDRVKIEWHQPEAGNLTNPCGHSSPATNPDLCLQSNWGANAAPVVRAQFIVPSTVPGGNFDIRELDESSRGNTVFLYPDSYSTPSKTNKELGPMPRYVAGNSQVGNSGVNSPTRVQCQRASAVYRCEATVQLPEVVSGGASQAILRLGTVYNTVPTSIKVSLYNGPSDTEANRVKFSGVQPVVDSTGRANDLFRRVEARLSLSSEVQYPEFAVDLGGSLCKDFFVTATSASKVAGGPAGQCN